MDPVILRTDQFTLRVPEPDDAEAASDFFRRNRTFLQPFYPTFEPTIFDAASWKVKLADDLKNFLDRTSMRTLIFDPHRRVIGVVNFSTFAFKPRYDCLLGYAVDEHEQGKGILTQSLTAAIPVAFRDFHMHRISAGYMPRNERSARVLRRLGFRVEGYFRDYLMINGCWEDHVVTTKLNEDWQPESL